MPEYFRKKNEAAYFAEPMIDTGTPASFRTGETVTDTAYYKDGAGAWTTLAITDTFGEIGTTGIYEIALTAAEMNHDQIVIKMTSTTGADNLIVIWTRAVDIEDLVRSTAPANTLDVSATGEAGIDWANVGGVTSTNNFTNTTVATVSTLSGHTAQTGDSYAIVNSGTFGNAQLVRSTTPANTLDVNVTGQAGIDLDNTVGTLAKTTDITGFNDITTAQVNAEVLDVMNTDTFAEPGQELPAATNTLVQKIGYIFKFLRNKIETTSTQISIYDDAGTTVDQKSTISDDTTTYTRGEFGSGP